MEIGSTRYRPATSFQCGIPPTIKLPAKDINTGYGVRIASGQGADHFLELARKTGFQTVARQDEKGWFHLELKKPV